MSNNLFISFASIHAGLKSNIAIAVVTTLETTDVAVSVAETTGTEVLVTTVTGLSWSAGDDVSATTSTEQAEHTNAQTNRSNQANLRTDISDPPKRKVHSGCVSVGRRNASPTAPPHLTGRTRFALAAARRRQQNHPSEETRFGPAAPRPPTENLETGPPVHPYLPWTTCSFTSHGQHAHCI